MKTAGAMALLLLAALAIPTAQAQDAQGVTVVPGALADPIPFKGSAQFPVTVDAGCAEILSAMSANAGAAPLTITVQSPPAWLTVTDATANLASQDSAQGCLAGGTGRVSYDIALPISVGADAPGIVDHTIQVVATLGATASEPAPATFTVAYHVNYTIVADAAFPLTVDGPEASFNVTVTQASNARSMVMVEEVQSSAGVLSGMGSQVYENDAGKPASKTFKVTFKAPAGEWANATASFTGYGHYLLLDGRAGGFGDDCAALAFPVCDAEGTPTTFSFVAGHSEHDDHDDEDKDSPAPVGAFLALGLAALAALARRRA